MKKTGKKRHGIVCNEKGIALAMVLVLSAITLGIMAGLIYMVTGGTQLTGIQKRYKTALDASLGGLEVAKDVVRLRGDEDNTLTFLNDLTNNSYSYTIPASCVPSTAAACVALDNYNSTYTKLGTKLNLPTACWTGCNSSLDFDLSDSTTYDLSFSLGTSPDPVYNVFVKVVDATYGNAGATAGLAKRRVVDSDKSDVSVPLRSYLYTIEVLSQAAINPSERSFTSALYAY
jgi:hypothetical protein